MNLASARQSAGANTRATTGAAGGAKADSKVANVRVGRFVLRHELGRGAQATVWCAYDERLDREVALKLLRADADTNAVSQWLHEARAVSGLSHPNIVPVFEADASQGQSYLVFELVRGPTLADLVRQRGALPAREAAGLVLGVLQALSAAHQQGIVHRDLKPSNILVDGGGRPRVMDFGIAARVSDMSDGSIVGTPGYISPEAARGMAPMPRMDVFSAGVLLAELLSGGRLLRESDPYRAIQRVQDEDLALPLAVVVDDGLRSVVNRALARDPMLRYPDAAEFATALSAWLNPEARIDAGAAPANAQTQANGTLDFLLRRMRQRSDFPALSDAVARIQRITASDSQSLNSLADEILKDVALTQKLLRLVNSAHYAARGDSGDGVSTVSRAVALVGFSGIRDLALSVVLVEHMKDQGQAEHLKREFLRALTAGHLASALARRGSEHEEAFLAAMFHRLGQLLAMYYFPDEAQQVRERLAGHQGDVDARAACEQTLAEVELGIRYDDLAVGVARSWGLPQSLQHCMTASAGAPPHRALAPGAARLRGLAMAADELAGDLLADDAAEQWPDRLKSLSQRHGRALGLKLADFRDAANLAESQLADLAPMLGLDLRRPARSTTAAPGDHTSTLPGTLPGLVTISLPGLRPDPSQTAAACDLPLAMAARAAHAPQQPLAAAPLAMPTLITGANPRQAMLAAGILDVTQTMTAKDFALNAVLRMVLETMVRALGLQRVLMCLRDPQRRALQGRFGLGVGAAALVPHFLIPLAPSAALAQNLFSAVCLKGADTLIADALAPTMLKRLPDWYQAKVAAPSFLLLPLMQKGAPFAMIYADVATPGGLVLDAQDLSLLRTLRNQAVIAFGLQG